MKRDEFPLTAAAVTQGLKTKTIGRLVRYFPSLSSTMDKAREAIRETIPEGTVIIAGEQTAGRGRLKRTWFSPAGNIALSVVLFPRRSELAEMIMLASLSVTRSIEAVTGLKADIKWPNDILIGSKKVSGILIEADARTSNDEQVTYVIIGIGINVALETAEYSEIEATATSLSVEWRKNVARLALVQTLLQEMDDLYSRLKNGHSLFEEWRKKLVTIGHEVTVAAMDSRYEGIAESVERDGSLMVRTRGGELRRVVAGDVTLRAK